MRHLLTGDDLFNNIVMLRAGGERRAVMVLEGPDDCAALDPHLDDPDIYSIPANGKTSVLRVVELVDITATPKVLGIVDSDREPLAISSPNIVAVDAYDLDTLIFSSGSVVTRVVATYSDPDVRDAHLSKVKAASPRDLGARIAHPVSSLRYISISGSMELYMNGFPIQDVADVATGQTPLAPMIDLAIRRSKSATVTLADIPFIQSAVLADISASSDVWREVCGHDLHAALTFLCKQAWGGGGKGSPSQAVIAKALRAAFSCAELMATGLFAAIKKWGERNLVSCWACPACT